MQKRTYYSKNLLREVLPSIIVNDVVTMIDEQLHLPVRTRVEKRIPEIIQDVINPKYAKIDYLIEDFMKNFFETFGYSIKDFALELRKIGQNNNFWDDYSDEDIDEKCSFLGTEVNHCIDGEQRMLIFDCMKLVARQEGLIFDDDKFGNYIYKDI